jgi:hypothetical protein
MLIPTGDPEERERQHGVRFQVLRDGGGRHGLQGHAHEAQGQAEEGRRQEDRMARGESQESLTRASQYKNYCSLVLTQYAYGCLCYLPIRNI